MTIAHRAACAIFVAACLVGVSTSSVWSAERAWRTGIWRDVQVKRPKVVFGIAQNQPNTGVPRGALAATQEQRLYVIDDGDTRYELKETTTIDAPRLDATIGEKVTFAVEKKTVYIKDADGREHRLDLTKKTTTTSTR